MTPGTTQAQIIAHAMKDADFRQARLEQPQDRAGAGIPPPPAQTRRSAGVGGNAQHVYPRVACERGSGHGTDRRRAASGRRWWEQGEYHGTYLVSGIPIAQVTRIVEARQHPNSMLVVVGLA